MAEPETPAPVLYEIPPTLESRLRHMFHPHALSSDQIRRSEVVKLGAHALARTMATCAPAGPELGRALDALDLASMLATSAIARGEDAPTVLPHVLDPASADRSPATMRVIVQTREGQRSALFYGFSNDGGRVVAVVKIDGAASLACVEMVAIVGPER